MFRLVSAGGSESIDHILQEDSDEEISVEEEDRKIKFLEMLGLPKTMLIEVSIERPSAMITSLPGC